MTKFDMSTKELVRSYSYNDIYTNRNDERVSVVKGRTIVELGTRTATTFVGNLYKVFDSSVKSYKYLLLVGVARQSQYCNTPVDEEEAVERAAENAQINPVLTYIVEQEFNDDYFMDLCIVMTEIMPTKFILTDEEKGIINI
jgi:hypothetical protein